MTSLESLRQELDQWHRDFEAMLWQRRTLTLQVWDLKKEQNLPWICPEREQDILAALTNAASSQEDAHFLKLTQHLTEDLLRHFQAFLLQRYASCEDGSKKSASSPSAER